MNPTLKTLLREQNMHEYQAFAAEYRRIARDLELPRSAEPPSKAAYYGWLSGQMKGLPHGYHCLVLEHMFAGWTAKDLFACVTERQHGRAGRGGLLGSITPAVNPEKLAGLWCTSFVFNGAHHADLTRLDVTSGDVAAKNSPPQPRTEGHIVGFHNDIHVKLSGRHLIGQWRNTSDSYYYGSVHLAVLPGETILDGYYTAVLTDTQVVADRWRFVRVEPQSTADIDLNTITLRNPLDLYQEHVPSRVDFRWRSMADSRRRYRRVRHRCRGGRGGVRHR